MTRITREGLQMLEDEHEKTLAQSEGPLSVTVLEVEARAFEHRHMGLPPLESAMSASRRLSDFTFRAVERAIEGWSKQCGVEPEEWIKRYGVKVITQWEGTQARVRVEPTLDGKTIQWITVRQPLGSFR